MADTVVEALAGAPHAILVVDDARGNLVAYRAVLEPLGREIVTASSGCEAIDLLGSQPFSLLLIDVRMPGLDGFATVELLRGQLHKLTPVIFITGHDDERAMQRAYDFGAVDYLVKPISPDILRGKVRNLVVLYEQGIELERRAALLAEQHKRLLEANALLREQDTNIGILAHDLRTPLASIVNGAQLLTKWPSDQDKARRNAERINRSARRMASMIRDILDFTRGRLGGRIPLNRQPTDLEVISRSVVDEIQTGHPTARVVVETAGKLTGDWDPARIEQALSNLLANAVQHGGSDIKLIASGEDLDQVVVTVSNGGRPIPPEQLPDLFAPFKTVRENSSTSGLGLGLFIVREIVQAHNGSVAVTSSSEGTAFTFRLPRSEAAGDHPRTTTENLSLGAMTTL
jgi:signal transduction histidine kinase